ncbi:hypothetical protein [Natronococcus sp.]|uniref:hypothetical protein n=1 Tax=Natronococcus sp. TaxID=35747 RepID=UPI0025F5928A|nr:hypothetical protein [Natronococcus sp.]
MDPIPTRVERIAAIVAILAALLLVPAAALGPGIAVVVLLFVAITGGTIAKARAGADGLVAFGAGSVPDDDPEAERYRDRREREAERLRSIATYEYDPRLDRLLAVALVVVGVGALAAVASGVGDGGRMTAYLLGGALVALNCALVAYATSHMNADD